MRTHSDRARSSTNVGPIPRNVTPVRNLVKVLADGSWLHDSVHKPALTPVQRAALAQHILEMFDYTVTAGCR